MGCIINNITVDAKNATHGSLLRFSILIFQMYAKYFILFGEGVSWSPNKQKESNKGTSLTWAKPNLSSAKTLKREAGIDRKHANLKPNHGPH